MTQAGMDRRVTKLEERMTEIEEGYGNSIYKLTRQLTRLELWADRKTTEGNGTSRGIAMIMERLGLTPIDILEVSFPTDEEVDAAIEADF